VQNATLWRGVLGVEKSWRTSSRRGRAGPGRARPAGAARGQTLRPLGRYDQGEGRRRWRGLDLGTIPVWLEADAPRVDCPWHGVVAVPWAGHGAGHILISPEAAAAWLPGFGGQDFRVRVLVLR